MVRLKPSIFLFSFSLVFLSVQAKDEPQALYILPVGGQQGSTVKVTIDGQTLADTYAVWTDCEELQASVKQVAETTDKIWEGHYLPEKQLTHQVTVQVRNAFADLTWALLTSREFAYNH